MTIIGIGTDIVNIDRFRRASSLERLVKFFLSVKEIRDMKKSPDQAQFAASRFAVKESVIKAYPGTLRPHDIEIRKSGRRIQVDFVRPCGVKMHVFISVAHELNMAIGYAILCRT